MKTIFYKHLIVSVMLTAFSLLWFSTTVFSGEEKTFIYFHSSETSINNFKSLKMEFDRYLSRFGPYELQPVKERPEFEKQIAHSQNCLILLSSWHYKRIGSTFQGKPVLIGIRNGKNTQKRLLVADKDFPDLASSAVNIASASSIQHTQSVMRDLFDEKKLNVDALRILTVPKDIDAIMAVGFGISGAALITEYSYDRLKLLTPVLYEKLKILATGPEFHLMILAARSTCIEKNRPLIQIIKQMPDTPLGQKQIHMLGLDSFQDATNSDVKILNITQNLTRQQEEK
ncbi:MAG: PhnD/SsuA/transferrin family substrate-binding protein [Pseudomonadota bacterium]